MSFEEASVLLPVAFILGALTTLALLAAWRSFAGRDAVSTAETASYERAAPAAECLGPAIGDAIRSGELQLHYQPKIDCRTSKICGAEALSRWTRPDGTRLQPDEFVRRAETLGGIEDLTIWGVERALIDSRKLPGDALGGPIFVNLSAKLINPRFAVRLIDLVSDRAGSIGFEVTETAVLDNPEEALQCLFALRDAGIALAIDDYGAGLSSLSYLKQIPAGELKIDRKFIHGITRSHRDPMIVRSTIDLCHGLGMKVTAEGVEDVMTASLLGVMGCDMIQGYFISQARPIDELIRFVEERPKLALEVPHIRKRAGT